MRSLRTLALLALSLAPIFVGCSDDRDNKSPEAARTATSLDVKGAPIGELVPPPAVIAWDGADVEKHLLSLLRLASTSRVVAWGGADSVEKLTSGAQAFLQQVTPLAPPLLDLLRDELRRKLALTKLDGIDWKRPARVAVFDPKNTPKAAITLVMGLSSKDLLLANLPAVKKENDEGNAVTYRDDLGRTICLNFIDDSVAVTWEKKQFAANQELFVRLARSTLPSDQVFYLSAQNVSALYAKEIDELVAQAKAQMATAPMAVPGVQSEVSVRVLSWIVTMFKDLDRVEATPRLPEDGAVLSFRLHPKAGSELQKSFKAIEARPHTLLARLPADAPLFASFSTNPDSVDGLTTRLVEWAMSVGSGGKLPEGYAESMKEYFQATGGEVAVAAHKPFTGEGLVLTSLLSVRNEEKLRAAMRKSKEIFKDKQMVETYKKAGITVDYRESAYKVGTVSVDTVDVKFEKDKNPLAQLGPFGDAMAELSINHMAVSKDLAVIGYGKDAKKTLESFLGGKVTGGLDQAAGPARAFRFAVKDPVGILYVAPVEVAKRISLGGKNPFAESLKDLAGTTGAALSFTAKDGVFEIMLDVPADQAKNIAQGLARAKSLMPR